MRADWCLSIMAYWGSKRRRVMCGQLWGYACGLFSAVHTYSRDPGSDRRPTVPSMCINVYDDRHSIDLGAGRGSSQKIRPALVLVARQSAGCRKHTAMSPAALFTRCELRLAEAFSAARFVVAAKPDCLESVSAILQTIWLADRCTPAQAATLLGKCGPPVITVARSGSPVRGPPIR